MRHVCQHFVNNLFWLLLNIVFRMETKRELPKRDSSSRDPRFHIVSNRTIQYKCVRSNTYSVMSCYTLALTSTTDIGCYTPPTDGFPSSKRALLKLAIKAQRSSQFSTKISCGYTLGEIAEIVQLEVAYPDKR